MDINRWSRTAISNATADPDINWQEGQLANTINDSARAVMAAIAAFRDDLAGLTVTAGTGNAYTASVFANIDTYRTGLAFWCKFDRANTGACTLSVNGLTTVAFTKSDGTDFVTGDIKANSTAKIYYNPAVPRFELGISSKHQHDIADITGGASLGAVQAQCPAGSIFSFAAAIPPSGFLICDGSSLLRTAYTALFANISTSWGAADSNHFYIPNLIGRTIVGLDLTSAILAAPFNTFAGTGGEANHILSTNEMPSHRHGIFDQSGAPNNGNYSTRNVVVGIVSNAFGAVPTDFAGGGVAHNNMQPSAALNWIIRT